MASLHVSCKECLLYPFLRPTKSKLDLAGTRDCFQFLFQLRGTVVHPETAIVKAKSHLFSFQCEVGGVIFQGLSHVALP